MMLEVRNLKRIYQIKNAAPVYALNDVTLKFPETGLVFILGKSGSGKSTLLNVMGGLDKADGGEIIINGKSSKDFSKDEMDSYRNTYLGFIFQEYNILSDFTVKENISLALELQHKKATDEEIDRILDEVDLKGFGKRKPNELSGGQKQRVAIARALVKEPKIIFGDEPTGALDSNTGRQVFETLKKLSKDKLVIIVSHDRDFAEHFGDRVIELKDGKVISDITKTTVECKTSDTGLSILGDNMLRIEKGRKLTVDDLPAINKAIENAQGDVYITGDSHVNETIEESARIDKDGNREEFINTDFSKIKEGEGTFEVVKSKFSLGKGFKMGARSLKVKPFRLAMTILLSTISFTLFGASTTLAMFSAKSALKDSIINNNINALTLNLQEKKENDYLSLGEFDDEKVKEIEKETGAKVYVCKNGGVQLNVGSKKDSSSIFYTTYTNIGLELSDEAMKDLGIDLLAGSLPTNSDEICITKYEYYSYKDFGIDVDGTLIEPKDVSYEKVISQKVVSYSSEDTPKKKTICGIVDTHFPEELLKYRTEAITYDNPDYNVLTNAITNSIHSCYFYGKETVETDPAIQVPYNPDIGDDSWTELLYDPSVNENSYFFQDGKKELNEGEAVLNLQNYAYNNLKDDNGTVYSDVFAGAYITEVKEDMNLFSVNEISDAEYMDAINQAAIYKTTSEGYLNFYQNDFATAKAFNESNSPYIIYHENSSTLPEEVDYLSASDNQKYRLYKQYLEAQISNHASNKYYQDYLNSVSYYEKNYASKYPYVLTHIIMQKTTAAAEEGRSKFINENYQTIYDKYKDDADYKEIIKSYMADLSVNDVNDEIKRYACNDFIINNSDKEKKQEYQLYVKDIVDAQKAVLKNYDFSSLKNNVSCKFNKNGVEKFSADFNYVGIRLDRPQTMTNKLYISKKDATRLSELCKTNNMVSKNPVNTVAFIGFNQSKSSLDKFLDYYFKLKAPFDNSYEDIEAGTWRINIQNTLLSNVENTAELLSILTKVFLYIGIALALFSMLLFYNFISVSINNKKREIGILRAVGAKRSDVFKIFYSEAFIISVINFVLSSICVVLASVFVNDSIMKEGIGFAIMSPNILVFLLLMGVSFITSFLSALLPVIRIANKKPIDAIQNR